MNNSESLQALEQWASAFMEKLEPRQRMRLAISIARDVRKLQARNIRGQRSADGNRWEKRKKYKASQPPIRYVYKSKDSTVRELEMSSYRDDGDRIIGYDREAGGIRTMLKGGMLRQIAAQHSGSGERSRAKRLQQMLLGMAKPKNLLAKGTASSAVLEFSNATNRIARIHHFGERDKVRPNGPEYDYPERALLGIGDAERQHITQLVLHHLQS